MRLGIDARMLGPGFGLARYTQQLVSGLENLDSYNEYTVFLRKENWEQYVPAKKNFKKVLADIPWYGFAEQINLSPIIYKEKVDLMHFPHWNVPLLYSGKFIVTIHDLIMYRYPRTEASTHGPIAYWCKDRLHRLVVRNAARSAEKIITPTEFTKQDLIRILKISDKKITVIPEAPLPAPDDVSRAPLPTYGIKGKYVLYVGAAYPHKNLKKLIEAWRSFTEQYGTQYQLVLAGREDYFYRRLTKYRNENPGSIVFTGFVTDAELESLYRRASVFIYPSLYEGFGLPPLEAMLRGVPVAASRASSLPEVLKDAAYYFDPESTTEIVQALWHILNDVELRERLRNKGLALCSTYSWEKNALETIRVYENVDK